MPLNPEEISNLLPSVLYSTEEWQVMIKKSVVDVAHARYLLDIEVEKQRKLILQARSDGVTLAAIGEALDLSRQRISQLLKAGL